MHREDGFTYSGKGRGENFLAICFLAVFLGYSVSGCSVVPSPFTAEEHKSRVEQDLKALFETRQPLAAPVSLHE
ncbi:hypothetical protein WCLP8_4430012 [uncultured Gammaproteobacteria bacterium]